MWYLFVEIFGFFLVDPKTPECPNYDRKWQKQQNIFKDFKQLCQILDRFRGEECRSVRK